MVPALLLSFFPAFAEERAQSPTGLTGLPPEADRQAARSMNLLIEDPRNDFLFNEVFSLYKTHKAEYRLLSFLQGAIKAKPGEKNLWILLGLAYREIRDYFLAKKYFEKAIELDAGDYFPRLLAAEILVREGRKDEAIETYSAAVTVARDPEDRLRAREALARAHFLRGQPEDAELAIAELDRILKEREYDLDVRWRVARLYEENQLLDRAVQEYLNLMQVAREEQPEIVCRAWLRIGSLYERTSQPERAVEAYREARGLVDDQHWVREKIDARILEICQRSGRVQPWLDDLQGLLKSRPRDVELRKETARALEAAGRGSDALECLDQAHQVAPEDVSVLEEIIRRISLQAEQAADEPTARKLWARLPPLYDRLQDINDEDLDTWVRQGEAWWKAGDPDRARKAWSELVREPEREARRYELAGRTLLRHGLVEEGIGLLRAAIALEPSRDDDRMRIAEALLQKGKATEARMEFQAILDRGGVTEVTYLRIAETYEQLGHLDRVAATLDEAVKRFPDSYEVCLRLGQLYLDQGENVKARGPLRQAYLRGPTPRARLLANLKLLRVYPNRYDLIAEHEAWLKEHPDDLTALMAIGDISTDWSGEGAAAGTHRVELTGMGAVGVGQLAYKTVQARDPLYLAAYEHNASLLLAADRFEDAVLEYRKMVVVNPVNKWAYYLRIGDLFADQGQLAEANHYWDFIRERHFADPQLLYQLGCRLLRAERHAEALEAVRRAAELHPNDYRLHLTLGHLEEHFQRYASAAESYTRAVRLATSDLVLTAQEHLGQTQRRYGEELWTHGRIPQALSVYRQAQAFLEKIREVTGEVRPEYPNVMIQIARCLEALGQKEDAEAAYAAVPGESWAWISPRLDLWLPYFLELRKQGRHEFPAQDPPVNTETGRKVSARLAASAWPVTQVMALDAQPGRLFLEGMDSQTVVQASDLSFQRQPFPLRYEERNLTLLFLPYLLLQPLAPPEEQRGWNPVQPMLWHRASPEIQVYHVQNLRPVASLNPPGFMQPWPSRQGQRLFFLSAEGPTFSVLGYDLETGRPLWPPAQAYLSDSAVFLTSSPDYLCVTEATDETVRFQILDADTGQPRTTIAPGNFSFWRNPLWLDQLFLSYDDFEGRLVAWRLPEGQPLYRVTFGQQAAVNPMALGQDTVLLHHRLLQERDIEACALDAATGRTRWRTRLNLESIDRGPVFAGNQILYVYRYRPVALGEPPAHDKPGPFFRAARGILVLDGRTGEKLADIDLSALMPEALIRRIRDAVYLDGHLFLATFEGHIFKLKLEGP